MLNQKHNPNVDKISHNMPNKKLSNLFLIMIFIVSYLNKIVQYRFKNLIFYVMASTRLDIYKDQKEKFEKVEKYEFPKIEVKRKSNKKL